MLSRSHRCKGIHESKGHNTTMKIEVTEEEEEGEEEEEEEGEPH